MNFSISSPSHFFTSACDDWYCFQFDSFTTFLFLFVPFSGSWDDYWNSGSIDLTGSYLAPFITTIGLYNESNEMLAVAKLPKPIKNLPDYPVNFIVRIDV